MDWDLKIPSRDFAELEQHQESNAKRGGRGLDLKLGGSGDFGSSINYGEPAGVPTASRAVSGSPSGPSKRARAPGNANQNVACSVDGCKADLSSCKDYHRRHKVCEVHSKTPMVMVGGSEQRFCQQCSRFHLLLEFDEVKRSCRKRLDGHNRRRRKPQPDPLNSGSLFRLHQGPRFSSYPHIFPPSAPDPAWAALIKNDEDVLNRGHRSFHLFERQQHSPPNSTFCIFKEGKQFPFLHEESTGICNGANIASPTCQSLFSAASSSESCARKMLSNGLSNVLDADCALSLLSSSSQTPAVNPDPMVPAEGIPYGQPLTQQFGNHCRYPADPQALSSAPSTGGLSCSGLDAEHIGNILVSDGSDVADFNCHGFYSLGASGTSDGHSEALPFSWYS